MADLALRLSALALLMEQFLVAAFVTAIVIALALSTLLEALETYLAVLRAFELRQGVDGVVRSLVTAAILSILVHTTGLASWEA